MENSIVLCLFYWENCHCQVKPTGWHTIKYDIVDGKYGLRQKIPYDILDLSKNNRYKGGNIWTKD